VEVLVNNAAEMKPELNPPAAGESNVEVQATATVTATTSQNSAVTKVIIAVHGVGDQYSYATIQSVVNQFCSFYRQPAAIPLGNFHTGQSTFSIQPPYPQELFKHFAFAEVYWAKIPRTLVDDKHTVEEAKKWARTIVERLRLRWWVEGSKGNCREEDFRLIHQVLTEMIQTIAVLDRISYLGDKAGLFTFDLRKLLDDYLGDVQVVTEFGTERAKILQAFADVMDGVHKSFPAADIYLVTHSEGTVVSFLGLLEGFRKPQPPGWVEQVRGFMTLGSPIDKHLALWPELFGQAPPVYTPDERKRIEWRNYYDHGDPIGFALEDARAWLKDKKWDSVFNFTDDHDFGFTRYPFPGKAHVDYWTDDTVFGHFIGTVVSDEPSQAAKSRAEEFKTAPGDVWKNKLFSYVAPYVGVVALLFIAVYILVKAVLGAITPDDPNTLGTELPALKDIVRSVAGFTGLLCGVTAMARIPRLTRSKFWRTIAFIVGGVSAGVYLWSVHWKSTGLMLGLSAALVLVVYLLSAERPHWGLKPLMTMGTLAVAGTVGFHLLRAWKAEVDLGPMWPVLIATIAFLYLWWLAALLFDLVFIWHLYIRHSRMLKRMDEIMGGSRHTAQDDETGRKTAPAVA
jgi:hypothetical protein